MTIQFSPAEVAKIRRYFTNIKAGETQKQLYGLQPEDPEWHTIFLLLRKLLAYGIYNDIQTDPGVSYKELQSRSQKSNDMLMQVHANFDKFDKLLAAYTAHQ